MTLSRQALIDDVRQHAFAPGNAPLRLGAEVELIPVEARTRRPASIRPIDGGPATLPVLQSLGRRLGWTEALSSKAGVPEFHTRDGGRITFEPGGQIEFSAPPAPSLGALLASLTCTTDQLRSALASAGIDTLTVGLDPLNRIDDTPLQLSAPRYARMDAHFARIGPHGARMMRQTASIQVCVDAGPQPDERWALLNALTPYVVSMFANSPVYEGAATGHQSTRRGIWGALDPSRTGVAIGAGDDPAIAYADFALGARTILLGEGDRASAPFAEFLGATRVNTDDWHTHLSTLFPEVRPRGYFELRSCDALPPECYVAPLLFVAALAYGPDQGHTAREIAGTPSNALLERAGRCGMNDPAIAQRCTELADLALREAQALANDNGFIDGDALERADDFFQQYTRVQRAPAHDILAPLPLPALA
ncbi:MAG: glutamate-cysteine ligase family protein [Gemmatimonadaceae bacterium]